MIVFPNPRFRLSLALGEKSVAELPGQLWAAKKNDIVIPFSRGQWALRALVAGIIKKKGHPRGMICIPEYFCEISLTPLRIPDFDIVFYRLTPELEPDVSHLEKIKEKFGVPDILLYVHYFGIPLDLSETLRWCYQHDVKLVEDAAHSLLPVSGIGNHSLPTIYTPWKFLNIPNGALLILPEETSFSPEIRIEWNNFTSYPFAWITKQLVLSLAQWMKFPMYKFKKIHVKSCDESEPPIDPGCPEIRAISRIMLARMGVEIQRIGQAREKNYRRLDNAFAVSKVKQCRLFQNLPEHFTPYVYPLRIKGASSVDLMIALNRMGIPAQPWSDLSPEVKGSADFPLSNALRKEVMVLPVHQDLSHAQIDWMGREVIKMISTH
ncbi:MAG: DegT/DnrJ/EryC1/StrS family aminotransferase [Syntrophaceae bacterium]